MYEPSRSIDTFNIAGFQLWDGALAISDLKVGQELELKAEPDNPYDANAVAIWAGKYKLGFVPKERNEMLSLMLHFGHVDVYECRVEQVAPERSPWHQVYVGLFIKDAR